MAIIAPSLEVGVEYVRQTLGVNPQVGGEHPRMGTHNCLLKLGEKFYLEVIAINPNASQPNRPRWFQLDEPDPSQPIRLATWIARTDDIVAASTASPIPLGEVEPMSRGQMNWLITIPADGSLPLHGIAPTLIQWTAGVHPAAVLQESGCALVRLEGFHPEAEKVISVLESIGFEGDFRVFALPPDQKPYLVAHIQTPAGIRHLSAPDFSLNSDVRQHDHMKGSI
ncbi:MAG: VOC family protein [Methylococcaceae bacterium]